jgi:hypothetical protein
MDVALQINQLKEKVASGAWPVHKRVLVDGLYATELGCRALPTEGLSASRRWAIVEAGDLVKSCTSAEATR